MSRYTNASFVNVGAKGSGSGTTITLGAPSSPAVNDVWIAVVHSSDNATISFTDWTQIVQGNGGGTDSRLSVWYHRYAGSTPNLIVSRTGTSGDNFIGGIAAFRDCKPGGSPVHVNSTISTGTDASIEHTGVTISIRGCVLLAINGAADDNDRTALGGRWISAFDEAGTLNYESTTGTIDGSIALSYDNDAVVAATGTVTQTQAASDQWAGVLIALEPRIDRDNLPQAKLTLSTFAPSVAISEATRAVVSSAVLLGENLTNTSIQPAAANLTLSTFAPSVAVTDNQSISPAQTNLVLTGVAPTVAVSDHVSISPAQGNLVLSTFAPTLAVPVEINPATRDLVLSTFAPSSVQDIRLDPAQGNLAFSTFAPTITLDVRLDPAAGNLTLSTFAPSALHAVTISPATAQLTLSSMGPELAIQQYLRPDADISDGSWTDQDGGTSLFSAIDEGDINDADYIKSSDDPVSDTCEIRMSDPGLLLATPVEVRYRYKKEGTGTIDLTVRLLQGATEIAQWDHTGISDTFVTASQTLTGPQFAAITDAADLRVEFTADLV